MIEIYHNPRCRKSRECLTLLESKTSNFKIIKYLDEPISEKKMGDIIELLGIKPIDLVRKNEAIWKESYRHQELSDKELIKVLINNPKLIERPIIINGKKAIIGRPPESILSIF